jgi:uncharacterized protein
MAQPLSRAQLLESIRAIALGGRLVVAFSGGVDSTLLLALSVEALGAERVLAVTASSESLPQDELAECQSLAALQGVELRLLRTRELSRAKYRENASDRCYHCKSELFERLAEELSGEEGIAAVVYGATYDDLGDHRPGLIAAREHRAYAPLADAGWGKARIRALSRELGLPTWDKPAQPCLASRIPYGQSVTREKLARIEAAERLLRGLGLRELRVRDHEQTTPRGIRALARVEVPAQDLGRLVADDTREAVVAGLRALGYDYVVLDLEGFRSGRLNDVLESGDLTVARRLPQVHA